MLFKVMFSSLILLLLAKGVEAQTVYLDSGNNQSYCEVVPVKIGFLKSRPLITRLYIKVNDFNLINSVSVHYWLVYEMFREDETSYFLPVGGVGDGNQTILVNNKGTIEQATLYLFNYIADSVLSIELK